MLGLYVHVLYKEKKVCSTSIKICHTFISDYYIVLTEINSSVALGKIGNEVVFLQLSLIK